MSPEVVKKKLVAMTGYLQDLGRYQGVPFEKFMERHYEIERILELLIMCANDIVIHLIAVRGNLRRVLTGAHSQGREN